MKIIERCSARALLGAFIPAAFMVCGQAAAKDETLECTLYIASSMDSDSKSGVAIEKAGLTLNSLRRGSLCVFADGSVADKQFVMVNRIVGDGSTGTNMGYSLYTMENGDSLSVSFTGEWGSSGYSGAYTILGGTGGYEGATGDGSITGTKSPWPTTGVVKIVLNVSTP